LDAFTALVVARGGSKSVPRKNLRPLGGKPLIAWTLEAARASRRLTRIVLSTDDPEIAAVGQQWGVETPFLRPAALAGDRSPVIDATLHAFQCLEKNAGQCPTFGLLLQPTSPFRTAADIDAAIQLCETRGADAVVSVTPAREHPYLLKTVDAAGCLQPWQANPLAESRRQDLPPVFALNGAIYLVRRSVLFEQRSWCPAGALAYVMPAERSLDIDTEWDLRVAQGIVRGERHQGAGE